MRPPDVLGELPEQLVIGTGAYARMRPDPETLEQPRQRDVEVEARVPLRAV